LSNKNSLKTWAFLIGLIIFGALATVVWQAGLIPGLPSASASAAAPAPTFGQIEPVEIRIRETNELLMDVPFLSNLDGQTYNPFLLLGFLILITVVPVAAVGGLLALALRVGDRQTNSIKSSEVVVQAQAALNQREAERVKALRQVKQPKPKPDSHEMPRWSLISTMLIGAMFALFVGTLIGSYLPDGSRLTPAMLNWLLVLLTVAALDWFSAGAAGKRLYASDDHEEAPIPWAWLYVIITGLLIVVLGLGFSIAMLPN
jgi:hypothetical protein